MLVTVANSRNLRMTYQIGDNGAHNLGSCQRQLAALNDFRRAVLGHVLRRNDNLGLVGVGDKVHGAAHALEDLLPLAWSKLATSGRGAYLAGYHVVGQVS